MSTTPTATLNIFRAGTHVATDGTQHTFSQADIDDLVSSYDPELAPAPLVVGHPKIEDPAYGWADKLVLTGDNVFAAPRDVEPQFAKMVNDKRFPHISASIYLPDSPGNPKPGHHYLRHIGFLGARAPAVSGLKPAQFAAADGALEFAMPAHRLNGLIWTVRDLFQKLRDSWIDRDGLEAADRIVPQWQINSISELALSSEELQAFPAFAAHTDTTAFDTTEIPMSQQQPADFAAREAALNNQKTELETREAALKKREDDARRADAAEFAQGLVAEGKLLPRQKAAVVELLLSLPSGTVLNFAQGEGDDAEQIEQPAIEALRELLTSLPKQVDFAEKSNAGVTVLAGEGAAADFAAPDGEQIDQRGLETHRKALAYQAANPNTSYIAAVKAVGG